MGHDDATALPWWKTRVVYQIYPRSFLDTDGDGIGDLPGITKGLAQIKELGAGIVWLSPIFVSPMADNGYDMADYQGIDPRFGTLADFDAMIAEARRLDLKIVLDIALNHSSTSHVWFQEALRDPEGPYRDYYLWADAPNNWESIFGGPAWTRPEGDSQYYLHMFDKTQADLNWANPAVRQSIYAAMRFWLERGVSGFRLDVVTVISKPVGLPDAPDPRPIPLYHMLAGGENLHPWLQEMRREVFDGFDAVAIGEGPGLDAARAARIVDPESKMLDMVYHFDLADGRPPGQTTPWDRVWFKSVFSKWDREIGPRGWNTCVMGNHDLRRLVGRYGEEGPQQFASAKALMAVGLLQRATPFIYQGDELGLGDARFTSIAELDDVWAKTTYRLALENALTPEHAFARAAKMTRDHARTPYPWDGEGGFTSGTPWLPYTPLQPGGDLASQMQDPASVRSFAKALIALRNADPDTWISGAFEDLAPQDADCFVFRRGQAGLVLINLQGRAVSLSEARRHWVTDWIKGRSPILSTGEVDDGVLAPWEVRVYR
jgi:oligo-1,6-glucosidase